MCWHCQCGAWYHDSVFLMDPEFGVGTNDKTRAALDEQREMELTLHGGEGGAAQGVVGIIEDAVGVLDSAS